MTKHYPGAPITEAIIDLRIERLLEDQLSTLRKLQANLEPQYPTYEDMFYAEGQFQAGSTITAFARQTAIGYRFISSDQKQILQARLDGFTFSRLAPYQSWEIFRDEALRLWQHYQSVANPQAVERVAVRYINRLDLPLPLSDLREYLRTVPEISPDLPQDLTDYFMQLQIPQKGILFSRKSLIYCLGIN